MTIRMVLDAEAPAQRASASASARPWRQWAWPACATLLVHGLALATLALNWAPVEPTQPVMPNAVSLTMISMPAPPVPQSAPAPAPTPPPPEPVVEAPPVAEPVTDTAPPEPVIDHAAIARKRRAEELKQEQLKQEQERIRARERQQQQALEHEQQLAREQEQQRQAEQARQAAAHQARAEAAAQAQAQAEQIRQYQPINKTAPDYPRRALDLAIEGDCTVEYDVLPNGRVSKPSVVSCDDPLFERPSLRAASGFRYEPHRVNGQAVTVPGVRNTFRYRIGS